MLWGTWEAGDTGGFVETRETGHPVWMISGGSMLAQLSLYEFQEFLIWPQQKPMLVIGLKSDFHHRANHPTNEHNFRTFTRGQCIEVWKKLVVIGDDFINGINDYQPKSNCKKTHVLESNLGFLYTFSIFSIFFPKNPTYVPYLVSFFGFIWGFSFFQQPTSGETAKGLCGGGLRQCLPYPFWLGDFDFRRGCTNYSCSLVSWKSVSREPLYSLVVWVVLALVI